MILFTFYPLADCLVKLTTSPPLGGINFTAICDLGKGTWHLLHKKKVYVLVNGEEVRAKTPDVN